MFFSSLLLTVAVSIAGSPFIKCNNISESNNIVQEKYSCGENGDSILLENNAQINNYEPNQPFLSDYFYHLNDNRPRNVLGICGYTAISMLLSYYDSFWCDDIIPECYENSLTHINGANLHSNNVADYQSHGVTNTIPLNADTKQDYEYLIHLLDPNANENSLFYKQMMDYYLSDRMYSQISSGTFLGHLFQIAINQGILKPHYDINHNELNSNDYLTTFNVYYSDLYSILNYYTFNNSYLFNDANITASEISTYNRTDPIYLTEKARIRNNVISILQQGKPVIVGGSNWNDINHNGVSEAGEIEGHVAIAYYYNSDTDKIIGNMGWSDKNNYPDNNYNYYDVESYFNLEIGYYLSLDFGSDCPQQRTANYYFSDKTAYYFPGNNSIYNTILPTDYGFPDSYNQTEVSSNLTIHSIEENGTDKIVNVKRVRTGYIHGECINLSTKRKYPGIAYLELTFPQQVKRITIDISWWSDNEMVSPLNSQYRIQSKEGGLYYDYADIWYEGISTDRTHPTKLIVEFEQDIYTIRFYGATTDYINDRNKGRLSLFNMVVDYWDLTI